MSKKRHSGTHTPTKLPEQKGECMDCPIRRAAVHEAVMEKLVEFHALTGVAPERQEQLDGALCDAAKGGHTDCCRLLLEAGADVNAGDGVPLFNATMNGHTETVALLREWIDKTSVMSTVTEEKELSSE